jgi:hypothetical protein
MAYTAKDYNGLIGMEGFSETLLKNHFTLYQGYVTNTNKVMDALAAMVKDGKIGTPEYAELKRRLGWEFNGMRLHEYYLTISEANRHSIKGANLRRKSRGVRQLRRLGEGFQGRVRDEGYRLGYSLSG